MIIYLVTKDVNNKVYIGQTVKTLDERIAGHHASMRAGQHTHLYRAMRLYGWDKFHFQQIDTACCQTELNAKEKYYIEQYSSISEGYNMVEGGRATPMNSEIVKAKHLAKMQDEHTRSRIRESVVAGLQATGGRSAKYRQHYSDSKKAFYASEAGQIAKEKFRASFKFTPERYRALNDSKNKSVYSLDPAGNIVVEFKRVKDAAQWWYTQGYVVKDHNTLCDRIKQSYREDRYIRGVKWIYRV